MKTAIIVLAAGKGSRMQSDLPKVLHPLAGRPMISHLMDSIRQLEPERTLVVVGPGMQRVEEVVAPCATMVQEEQLGTADAVKTAAPALDGFTGNVLIVYGDTPLISSETLERMLQLRQATPSIAVVVLGFRPEQPGAYGRLVVNSEGGCEAIVEYLECDDEQRRIDLCNSGVMAIDGNLLQGLLAEISNDNAKGEFYLTDIVSIARKNGLVCGYLEGSAEEVLGINTPQELRAVEVSLAAASFEQERVSA